MTLDQNPVQLRVAHLQNHAREDGRSVFNAEITRPRFASREAAKRRKIKPGFPGYLSRQIS